MQSIGELAIGRLNCLSEFGPCYALRHSVHASESSDSYAESEKNVSGGARLKTGSVLICEMGD